MPSSPNSTWIDRAWQRVANTRFWGDWIDLALYYHVSRGNLDAVKTWKSRAGERFSGPQFKWFSSTILSVALDSIDKDGPHRKTVASLMLDLCEPFQGRRRQDVLVDLAVRKDWDLLFQFAKTHSIDPEEATRAFSLFAGELNTSHDQLRALEWFERYGGDPAQETKFLFEKSYRNGGLPPLVLSILEYTLRHGDSVLIERVLDRLIKQDTELPSYRFSGMFPRDTPLSAQHVMQMEALGVVWQDVLKREMPDDEPSARISVLLECVPELATLIPLARKMARAENEALALSIETPLAQLETAPTKPVPRRRI